MKLLATTILCLSLLSIESFGACGLGGCGLARGRVVRVLPRNREVIRTRSSTLLPRNRDFYIFPLLRMK